MDNIPKIIVDACCVVKDAHLKGRAGKGKCACGVLIIDEHGIEHEFSKYLGEKTVPEAEFEGLIFSLDKASEILRRNRSIEVWMDSDLVVKWMNKDYRLKKEHIKPLYDRAHELSLRFAEIRYFHHPRDSALAKRVDALAHKEYNMRNS